MKFLQSGQSKRTKFTLLHKTTKKETKYIKQWVSRPWTSENEGQRCLRQERKKFCPTIGVPKSQHREEARQSSVDSLAKERGEFGETKVARIPETKDLKEEGYTENPGHLISACV